MTWQKRLASRFSSLFQKRRLERELDEELRLHIDMQTDENFWNGMSAQEARRAALRDFGGLEQVKEEYRERRGLPLLENLVQDVRFAFRSFSRDRGYTSTVLVALVLGVGIGTTMFAVVNGVLIQPLPYEQPDHLVSMWREEQGADGQPGKGQLERMISRADFEDWRDRSGLFENALDINPNRAGFEELGQFLNGAYVDGDLCRTFGIQPILGRCLDPNESKQESDVILLTYDTWKTRFGADPAAVGSTIHIMYGGPPGRPVVIVGVLPPGFYLRSRDVGWIMPWNLPPVTPELAERARNALFFWGIGRLRDGLSLEQAQSAADAFSQGLAELYPSSHTGRRLVLMPLPEEATGGLRDPLLLLVSAAGIVLLILCSNVAALALVRSLTRSSEFAVRSAIGAGRSRLIRQLITENVVLSLLGGLFGLALAVGLVRFLRGWLPKQNVWSGFFLQADRIAVDPWVALFSLALALISGVLFGLLPAVRATSFQLAAWVKDGGHSALGPRDARSARRWLGIAQVSLAVVLATWACVSVRTFMNLHQQGPGLQTERTIGMTIFAGTRGREGSQEESQAWWSEVREALGQLPGVQGVASSYSAPVSPPGRTRVMQWVERAGDKADPVTHLDLEVGPNYFRLLGIPLIEGRHFDLRDQPDSPRVAIVSAEAARRFWPGESAIGKKIRRSEDVNARFQRRWTVIGVVGDVRASGLQEGPEPAVYGTQSQGFYGAAYWMVKSARDPESLFPEIVDRLHAIDPGVTIEEPGYQVLDDVVWDSTWQLNYTMVLLAGLAGLALLISAIGVYGVLSYAVRQRTREVGLRMAVGAGRAEVLRMFLLQGLLTGMVGVVAGLIVSAGLSPLVGSLLYGVEPPDSTTFAIVAVVMLSAVSLASYLPAAKAADLDPTEALRRE